MKVMSLNIWGGRIQAPLLEFIKLHKNDVDIFCFQEVYYKAQKHISTEEAVHYSLDIFSEIQSQLPNHDGFFSPVVENIYGLCMFVRKEYNIIGEGAISIHDNPCYPGYGPTHSRNLQWIKVRFDDNRIYAILNVHGLWDSNGKIDSSERLAQSQKIREFIDTMKLPTILCGDFNLRIDTDSVRLLEDVLDNLIRRYSIASTRTALYPKKEKERFADYIFISPDVNVNDFQVLTEEVSDHAPLVLDFSYCP